MIDVPTESMPLRESVPTAVPDCEFEHHGLVGADSGACQELLVREVLIVEGGKMYAPQRENGESANIRRRLDKQHSKLSERGATVAGRDIGLQ